MEQTQWAPSIARGPIGKLHKTPLDFGRNPSYYYNIDVVIYEATSAVCWAGYCYHDLGDDEKSKEFLVESYYVYKVMEKPRSCKLVKNYAWETFQLEID